MEVYSVKTVLSDSVSHHSRSYCRCCLKKLTAQLRTSARAHIFFWQIMQQLKLYFVRTAVSLWQRWSFPVHEAQRTFEHFPWPEYRSPSRQDLQPKLSFLWKYSNLLSLLIEHSQIKIFQKLSCFGESGLPYQISYFPVDHMSLDFNDASLRLIVGPIIVIIVK